MTDRELLAVDGVGSAAVGLHDLMDQGLKAAVSRSGGAQEPLDVRFDSAR